MMIFLIVCMLGIEPVGAQTTQDLELALKKTPTNLALRLKLATALDAEKKHEQVIELLNSYTDQLTPSGFLLLGSSYAAKKDFVNEVRVLNLLNQKDESNHRWRMLLAQAYLKQAAATSASPSRQQELLTSGVLELRTALKIAPKFKPAYDLLLSTLLQAKANHEAREVIVEGIQKFGRRPELFRELCRLDSQDGFLDQAVNHCRESIQISPDYPDHHVFLIQAYFDQKEDLQAEQAAVKAARKFPKSEFVQWAVGQLFYKKKNYPVAARYFEAASAADPNSGRAWSGLALSTFETGEAGETKALEYFKKACAKDKAIREGFLSAAGRLKQKGNYKLGDAYSSAANVCQ